MGNRVRPVGVARCVVLGVMVLMIGGCGADRGGGGGRPEEWVRPRGVRACGVPGAVVLYPRHRVVSAFPPVIFVVPGVGGPVEVELAREGAARRWRTTGRSLTWPEGWNGLRVGEVGRVVVRAGGTTAVCGFVRAPMPELGTWWRDGRVGVRRLLDLGLPMEAARLAAVDPRVSEPEREQALFRAGVPTLGLWRGF